MHDSGTTRFESHKIYGSMCIMVSYVQQAKFISMDVPILLLSILMRRDVSLLENFEEDITNLENIITPENIKNIPERISKRRRLLLKLKEYYDSLFDLFRVMEENSNGLLNEKQLKSLHLQTSKAGRLSRTIQNSRDYITRARESHQAQLNIQLNSVMKSFTAITTQYSSD